MDLVFQSSPHVPEEPAVGGPEAGDGVPVGSRTCNGCNGSVTAMDPAHRLWILVTAMDPGTVKLKILIVVLLLVFNANNNKIS